MDDATGTNGRHLERRVRKGYRHSVYDQTNHSEPQGKVRDIDRREQIVLQTMDRRETRSGQWNTVSMGGTPRHQDQAIEAKSSPKRTKAKHHRSISRNPVGRTRRHLQNVLANRHSILVAEPTQRRKRRGNHLCTLYSRKQLTPPGTENLRTDFNRGTIRHHLLGYMAPGNHAHLQTAFGIRTERIERRSPTHKCMQHHLFRHHSRDRTYQQRTGPRQSVPTDHGTERTSGANSDRSGIGVQRITHQVLRRIGNQIRGSLGRTARRDPMREVSPISKQGNANHRSGS